MQEQGGRPKRSNAGARAKAAAEEARSEAAAVKKEKEQSAKDKATANNKVWGLCTRVKSRP
jgi:hypothetical protein